MKRKDRAPELRQRLSDPHDLCRRLGLIKGAERQADGLLVLCPAHKEHTPSCSVRRGPDGTIAVRCFACSFTGDALDLVAAVAGLSRLPRDFSRVLERAAELAGMTLVAEVSGVDVRPPRTRAPARPTLPDDTFAAMARALLSMGRLDGFRLVRDAELYLAGRRLLDAARAEGWAALPPPGESADSWARVLSDSFGGESAERSGLLYRTRAGWSFTHGENRLLIPWRSPDGEVYTIQRRRLDASGAGGKYVFPKGRAARWPYGCEGIAAGARIAVVEGAVDVLALRQIAAIEGKKASIVGIPGVARLDLAAKLPVGKVAIVALDADTAGTAAIQGLREILKRAGATTVPGWNPDPPFKDWAAQLEALP